MAMTVNNLSTLTLLNILNSTSVTQENVLRRMATGNKINRGSDDPAGLLALTQVESELIAVKTGITNNQRTDAVLGVADNALTEVGNLIDEIQRLANETANDSALTADEIAANQAQIDDALASIDRIVSSANFNGTKLLDGSLAINVSNNVTSKIGDIRVYSRRSGSTNTQLDVNLVTAAKTASGLNLMTAAFTSSGSFSVTGKLGTAIIEFTTTDTSATIISKINAAKNQTGVSAVAGGVDLYSTEYGANAFVRTKLIEGPAGSVVELDDSGADAVVTVNGQQTAVDGRHVAYSGQGISMAFELLTNTTGTYSLAVKGDSASGDSGATFNLGTSASTQATIGLAGVWAAQLGTASVGYLRSMASGGANSLINNPIQAATIAREAAKQVSTLQGRIGGFQKFQVRTAISSLQDSQEGLEALRGVINDVDYAVESAELNRQNVLLQSAMSLLGLANQQSSQVLSLLR